jgi:sterol desaturase/sphingolipid hydroxylase (fatty acid hydroxylase superfamily)
MIFFYVIWRRALFGRKIQQRFPDRRDYWREFCWSVLTFAIFSGIGWLAFCPEMRPFTQWYFRFSDYGAAYFVFSVVAMILIHDAYFYWAHRLMHWRPIYGVFHRVHHESTNPSPWAAFAFHPLEAVVEAGILMVFAFAFPVHPFALIAFLLWMTVFNVSGHLGYEMFPAWFTRSWLGRWLNTPTNHNLHHKYFHGNYGIYFRWWDVWMGTTHEKYEGELAEVQGRPYLAPAPSNSKV